MIESLRIQSFALVDDLALEFSGGFSVFTGETGAGKSLLLQALGLVLGDRASREAVRSGADQARVEALFAPAGDAYSKIRDILEEADVPWEEGEPLVITRSVSADGRSRAAINGSLAPLNLLDRVGTHLVELSSQHQHQGLLREEGHLGLLDTSLSAEGQGVRTAYREAYDVWAETRREVTRLRALECQARERSDFLRYQVEEIRAAGLEPGEDERLRQERELLLHANKLQESYGTAEEEVYSGSDAALDRVARAERCVEAALPKDPHAEGILQLLGEARAALDEAALRLRERRGALDADPGRLEALEDRLEVIRRLEKKHGRGVDAILERLEALETELWELENTELALEEAERRQARGRAELEARADQLRGVREEAAHRMEKEVGRELEELALGRSAFRVELTPVEPGPHGAETARFLLAANPGEPPKPLTKVASGGELSRILLALKNALRDETVETLIFDEVDAGIGGATADAVAERLASLASACQVVCISHLHQIASRAEHHYRVDKVVVEDRTVTRVRRLDPAERVEELARMLAGRKVTDAARQHARELVGRATP